jgi:hypothetical protein
VVCNHSIPSPYSRQNCFVFGTGQSRVLRDLGIFHSLPERCVILLSIKSNRSRPLPLLLNIRDDQTIRNCVLTEVNQYCNINRGSASQLLSKVKLSLYRPWRPLGLREVEAPTFSDIRHRWRQVCQPYTPAAFYPQEDSWYSFLLEAESTSGP